MPKHLTRAAQLPRICISVTGATPGEMLARAEAALRESPFVELRLDWLSQPRAGLEIIAPLLRSGARRNAVLQATCRREAAGGRFRGSVTQQIELLLAAASAGCRLVDCEVESAEADPQAVARLKRDALLILSFHDFTRTPPLLSAARRLRRFDADYYKLVPTAARQTDNCAVLEFLAGARRSTERGKWIAFCMGEAGLPSRVLALSRGSAFVYASPSECEGIAAPGQLTVSDLRNRYRAERISARTRIYGLVGNPVRQSIGAAVHNAALQQRGIDAVYLPFLSESMADFRAAAARNGLRGFSVTIPHKRAVMRLLAAIEARAVAAGAANTVRIRGGKWYGMNSDVEGILRPLKSRLRLGPGGKLPQGFDAVIVGAGGAARAALVALRELGCNRISIAARNSQKAGALAMRFDADVVPLEGLASSTFDLLIHTTPVGMWPRSDESLLAREQITAKTVFDLVYNPPRTRLLQLAEERGCRIISGLEMFLAQAACQFEWWTGKPAPTALMRAVAKAELKRLQQSRRD